MVSGIVLPIITAPGPMPKSGEFPEYFGNTGLKSSGTIVNTYGENTGGMRDATGGDIFRPRNREEEGNASSGNVKWLRNREKSEGLLN